MQDVNCLALEIFKQADSLKMSLYPQNEAASTLRHYNQCQVNFSEIESLCAEATGILNKANKPGIPQEGLVKDLAKAGQVLWDHLLARRIRQSLKSVQGADLILSIDEELIGIPWELLYDGRDFLCLNFNLGRLVRTKKEPPIVRYRSFSGAQKMLILANPTNDLKSAYLEGVNIRNQFDHRRKLLRIDLKSTRIDRLYVKKNLCDYDIVHFAGHCEYEADNPGESGWVLNGGRFSVRDVLAMGSTVSLPSLIFSNACYSAATADGFPDFDYQQRSYSLASAFLFSGVRHYIGAAHRIEDAASYSFAREFYRQLISGRPVGEAVRLSRLKLVKEHGIGPLRWAGYLLYGDPNFILFRTHLKHPVSLKPKKRLSAYKKQIRRTTFVAVIILAGLLLCLYLPSINPNTYVLFSKSQKLFAQGRNEESAELSGRIIEKDPLFLAAYPLAADAYQRVGDKEKALKYCFDYVMQSQKRQDKKSLVRAYTKTAWFYHLNGDYPKAFDFYEKAAALSRENKDKLNEAVVLRKLAVWYTDKEDYSQAMDLLVKSSEINRQRQNIYEHKYNLARDYFDIGLIFSNKDDYPAAKEFYRRSLALFKELELENELSDCYFNIGEIYLFEKEYQKALEYYIKGLEVDKRHNNKFNLASDYNMIGELYLEMDNFTEAEAYFKQSVSSAKAIEARPDLAAAYYNLGFLYKRSQDNKSKVRQYLRQAQEIYRSVDPAVYEEIRKELLAF